MLGTVKLTVVDTKISPKSIFYKVISSGRKKNKIILVSSTSRGCISSTNTTQKAFLYAVLCRNSMLIICHLTFQINYELLLIGNMWKRIMKKYFFLGAEEVAQRVQVFNIQ